MTQVDTRYPGPETIHQHTLPNGITLLVYENFASQAVVIEGLVRAGALGESRATAGLASLTAASLMRGATHRTFEQIYEELEGVGADLGFSSGFHTTGFAANSLVEDVDLVLDVMADALRQPAFPEKPVAQLRGQMLTGLQLRADDTQRMARLTFNELLYDGHPFGRSASGYVDSVAALTPDDLAEFHGRFYGPAGMIVTVVGGMAAADVVEKVTAVLGDWHTPQQEILPPMPDAPRPTKTIRAQADMPGKSQADIVLGLPGPRRRAPDYLDVSLMNTILGVFGMMGRIGQNVREAQGLAYYAYSNLRGGLGPSPWIAAAGVAPPNVEKTIASIRQEIQRIQDEPVTAEELADCQAYRTGSLPVSLETNSGLAGAITDMALYELGLDYLQRFPDEIRSITPARIQAAAQKYLSADHLAIAVAGPDGQG
ncbi:MAG: M16 family metallopeptidase [Anaerolineae bacterium]